MKIKQKPYKTKSLANIESVASSSKNLLGQAGGV
jgi:hypothetical protein